MKNIFFKKQKTFVLGLKHWSEAKDKTKNFLWSKNHRNPLNMYRIPCAIKTSSLTSVVQEFYGKD